MRRPETKGGVVDGALSDVTFTLGGDAVVVGATSSLHPLVLDERAFWAADEVLESTAFLQSIATASSGVLHATGYGVALRSEAAGVWVTEPVNYSGANWRVDGIRAEWITTWAQRSDRSLADDGARLYVMGVDYRSGSIRPWLFQRPINGS